MRQADKSLLAIGRPIAGVLAAIVLASLPDSEVLGADQPVAKPHVKVNDSWSYRSIDLKSGATLARFDVRVTFAEGDVIVIEQLAAGARQDQDGHYTSEWNARALPSGYVYKDTWKIFKFPLQPGQKFESTYEHLAIRGKPTGHRFRVSGAVEVLGWEEVRVPAGEFRAMRIEFNGRSKRLDTGQEFWVRHQFWYVPSVKRWVKYATEGGVLAIDFSRADELTAYRVE